MNNLQKPHPVNEFGGFEGKVVVITGSSKGIGKATALGFLKAGAHVVINGRNMDALKKTALELRQKGFEPFEFAGDVSDIAACNQLISRTVEKFGKIDILINNAGGGFRGKLEETPPHVFKKVVDSNLMTAAYCTAAAIEHIKNSSGSIVFISSLAGLRGLPYNGPYCVAKMGLTALAQTLKLELHGTGVHIGILMVGLTDFDEDKKVTGADGSLIVIQRGSDQTRGQVAGEIMQLIRKKKFKVVLTRLGKMSDLAQRFCPSMVEYVIRKSSRTNAYNQ